MRFIFFKIFFFWLGPFLKSLLNLLQDCFCFMLCSFGQKACEILAPLPVIELAPFALEGEVLTTGSPGKFPLVRFKWVKAFKCLCIWCTLSLSHVWLFVTPWTVTLQAPLSMEFSRQEYWNGLPFPPPGNLPNPGIKPSSPALTGRVFNTGPPFKCLLLLLSCFSHVRLCAIL